MAQEICDNGLDDDGDLLIDLNDPDCDCESLEGFTSLIPNPSFEDTLCCPIWYDQMDCAEEWVQASWGTSDYYNLCGFDHYPPGIYPEFPLPHGGLGFVGFGESPPNGHEYIGACLTSPILAGETYTLHFYTAWAAGTDTLDFSIYGTPNCADLPWAGTDCPVGIDGWELLTSTTVDYETDGSWQEVIVTFTPGVNIEAIALGGPCGVVAENSYYYLDGLTMVDEDHLTTITESGDWCEGNLTLSTEIDTFGGTWQWYKEGIALVGETGESLEVNPYGFGTYTALYSIGGQCLKISHAVAVEDAIFADFSFESVCPGETVNFENTSVYPDGEEVDWEWDFDDGSTSTEENPDHIFDESGTYSIQLIGSGEGLCSDTAIIEVTIYPEPEAEIEFIAGGLSSEDGSTGGCILNPVQFNDLSTIDAPGTITDWDWDFGDGATSTEENPEHTYGATGTYTITLTVTSANGCSSATTLPITMTNGLAIDVIFSEPTCFGFSDGSITLNTEDLTGEAIYEIRDSEGTLRNEDNSNTANTLSSGWYYYTVTDDTECAANDSIYLDEPEELDADLTVSNVLCYGDASGWVGVDSVFNTTGDYGQTSFYWAPNPSGDEGIGADSLWNVTAGDYTLTINDDNGCSKVFDFTVTEPDSLELVEFGSEPAYCRLYGYQSGNGVVFGAAAGGTADYTYEWTNLLTGDVYENTTWGGLNPADYQLRVIDENGCQLIQTLTLDSLNPTADFTVTSPQLNTDLQGTAPVEVVFTNTSSNFANPNNPLADTTFFWALDNPASGWEVSHDWYQTKDTVYTAQGQSYTAEVCLVAINHAGCKDTACKIITIYEPIVFTPINIFTPNEDGTNDYFRFDLKAASIAEFKGVIINRWGETVFIFNAITDQWDGTNQQGNPCTDGVYFYSYEAITDNNTKLVGQGTVQLVR